MTPFTEGQEERIREAVRSRIKEYSNNCRDAGFNLTISPFTDAESHVVSIGTSILATKWGIGYPGGSFVQAVVDNNLTETFSRADGVNLNCIRFYVYLIYNQSYVS
ncbi:hypothetical protein UFOVP1247_68 [uncultured Caudovirales phage]|uniref:Uncharacterized protein n=1 Tax=uncultured Caudovirales phage TaxID=2100421 RepID=A0A6J5R785_9CAUD|nr:hypothetical protein UFOVP970_108 [uncultured Caudovirales phage]CAB4193390.1 hypothetical protein UFOVP1247_68 [uncultured Caudovirales phage]